jgi:hypothetical protein
MALSPMPGSYVRVYRGSGEDQDYTDEAMEVVDFSASKWGGYTTYQVWRIVDPTKRMMNNSAAPVFQFQDEGAGDWATLTADEVWYGAGYIVVLSGLDEGDAVRCHSGKYLVPTEIFGCEKLDFEDITEIHDVTDLGKDARERFPGLDDWNATLEAFIAAKCAEVSSTGGNANSHIRAIHRTGGVAGNSITFDLQDNDAEALSVGVVASAITVDLDTDGEDPISTADEVIAALNADADVQALGVYFMRATGETGAGVVADSGPYTLVGGADELIFDTMKGAKQVFNFYRDYDNGLMYVGLGYVDSVTAGGDPTSPATTTLKVSGHNNKLWHVIEEP